MNISKLTNQEIAALISAASAELEARFSTPTIERMKDQRPVVMREPSEEDKDFVLRLKTQVISGDYATAADRQRIADLANAGFEQWIKRQGLPTDKGTGPWRKMQERARFDPSKER